MDRAIGVADKAIRLSRMGEVSTQREFEFGNLAIDAFECIGLFKAAVIF